MKQSLNKLKNKMQISKLFKQTWMRAKITTDEAEKELSGRPEGSFLIRLSSSTPGAYALAVVIEMGSSAEHYKLNPGNKPWSVKFRDQTFDDLYKFVETYSKTPIEGNIVLQKGQTLLKSKIQGDLKLEEKIGSGQFGDVYKGSVKEINYFHFVEKLIIQIQK